jgi:pyruvate/2-oxoglutarate dehydrogenase complex dihydrolipoamide dehydrogenase (E3) component
VHASKLGAKVAVIEKKKTFGGPTGLTSKAIREAAKRFCSAIDQIGGDRRKQIKNLWKRSFPVLKSEAEVYQAKETRDRLSSNKIDLFIGEAVFEAQDSQSSSKHPKLRVSRPGESVEIISRSAIIATGSRPNRPTITRSGLQIPFLKGKVVDATG